MWSNHPLSCLKPMCHVLFLILESFELGVMTICSWMEAIGVGFKYGFRFWFGVCFWLLLVGFSPLCCIPRGCFFLWVVGMYTCFVGGVLALLWVGYKDGVGVLIFFCLFLLLAWLCWFEWFVWAPRCPGLWVHGFSSLPNCWIWLCFEPEKSLGRDF